MGTPGAPGEEQAAGEQAAGEQAAKGPPKKVLLRLSHRLWQELAAWAQDDFRSINGQIEYLLSECVRQRRKPSQEPRAQTGPKAKDP